MRRVNKANLMVYLFFIIVTFCKGMGLSNSSKVYVISYIFGVLILLIKIVFLDKFTKRELFIIGTILVIGIINFIVGKETTVLFSAIALACIKNIEIKKIIKLMFWTRLLSFIIVIIASLTGIVDSNVMSFYREGEIIYRNSFGYSHPNLAHSSFAIIIILFGYCYYKKINIFSVTIMEFLNLVLYNYTLSRTGFLIITIYLIFIYTVKNVEFINKKISHLINPIFLGLIVVSFGLAIGYGKIDLINNLDTLLTGRIYYMHKVLTQYSVPLISYNKYAGILFDNGYFDLIYNGGVFASIWFLYNQYKTNKELNKKNNIEECIITIFFLFYSLTESYYASILMNPSLLFFAYSIYSKNPNKKEGEKWIKFQ